jgi:hypothetical protein
VLVVLFTNFLKTILVRSTASSAPGQSCQVNGVVGTCQQQSSAQGTVCVTTNTQYNPCAQKMQGSTCNYYDDDVLGCY